MATFMEIRLKQRAVVESLTAEGFGFWTLIFSMTAPTSTQVAKHSSSCIECCSRRFCHNRSYSPRSRSATLIPFRDDRAPLFNQRFNSEDKVTAAIWSCFWQQPLDFSFDGFERVVTRKGMGTNLKSETQRTNWVIMYKKMFKSVHK